MAAAGYGRPTILFLGDSITQFGFSTSGQWVARVADVFQRRCDVVNRGYSGYNTRWFRRRLPDIVNPALASSAAAAVVFLGVNDAKVPDVVLEGLPDQHVPLDEYKNNLKIIVEFLISNGVGPDRILMIPPIPCYDLTFKTHLEGRFETKLPDAPKKKAVTRSYHDACVSVAEEIQIRILPGVWKALDFPEMFCDGLHLSEEGSVTLANLMIPILEDMMSGIPDHLPDWKSLK